MAGRISLEPILSGTPWRLKMSTSNIQRRVEKLEAERPQSERVSRIEIHGVQPGGGINPVAVAIFEAGRWSRFMIQADDKFRLSGGGGHAI
jgi:hypothetical protein